MCHKEDIPVREFLKRTSRSRRFAALCVILLLPLSFAFPQHAMAAENTYVIIDGVRVDSSLGVTTSEQLTQRLLEGYVQVDYVDGRLASVEPLSEEDEIAVMNSTRTPCRNTDVCLTFRNGSNRGFYGTGYRAGAWSNVTKTNNGNWTAQYRISYNGGTYLSQKSGPHTVGKIYHGTITQVRIF